MGIKNFIYGLTLCCCLLPLTAARAASPETEVLLKLLQNKGLVSQAEVEALRRELAEQPAPGAVAGEATPADGHYHGVVGMPARRERLEKIGEPPVPAGAGPAAEDEHYHSVIGIQERLARLEKELAAERTARRWPERIRLGGLLEAEAVWGRTDYDDPAAPNETAADLTLATAQLDVDVDIAPYVAGHLALLWEEDATEPVDLDEAVIALAGFADLPLSVAVGKMYVPFGRFESHFISDPLTLELGETRETAVLAGFTDEWFELFAGVFNGDIDEAGTGDRLEGYVASAAFSLPAGRAGELEMSTGFSYISNLADSNGLEEVSSTGTVRDYVAGYSAFLSAVYRQRLFLLAEYLGAAESFAAGAFAFDGGLGRRPRAYNVELAYGLVDQLELAVRYEGCQDCGDFLAERQYGAALIYGLNDSVSLALEYLDGEFANDDRRRQATTQLAVSF